MIIERIEIVSFGNLKDLAFDLSPGINVITGTNESGKSMVAAFISYMLYGFGTYYAASDLSEREKRVSWETKTAEGTMTVCLSDGRRFRIERVTEVTEQAGRIGYREDSKLVDLSDGSETRFHSLPGEDFFAVPEQIYTNTALFGQLSSRLNEKETTQAMENLLFSGDERVSSLRALKTMSEARYSLSHPSGVGGAIYELAAQTDATRNRLTQAMRLSARIHKTETDLHKLSEKIRGAEAERDRLSEVDTYYRGYLTICTFDKLHEIENAYADVSARRDSLRRENEFEGFLPNEEYLGAVRSAERVCDVAHRNYLRTQEKLQEVIAAGEISPEEEALFHRVDEAGGEATVEAEYKNLYRVAKRHSALAWTLAVLGALLLGLGLFLVRPLSLSPATALLLLAVLSSAVVSVLFFRNRARTEKEILTLCHRFDAVNGVDLLCSMKNVEGTRRRLAERHESITRAEENTEISRENFESLYREFCALAAKWNKSPAEDESPAALISTISEAASLFLQEDRRLSEELSELRGRMLSLREELAGKSEIAIRAEVPPARREAMKKINYKTIQEGLSYYRTNCENLRSQYEALLAELNEYRRSAENPALLRAELATMEDRLAVLRRRYRAYGIASDAIQSASARLRAEISPRLSQYAGKLMDEATEGRYPALEVTNRLSISYRDGEELRPLASASGATQEIAYISLRLALIDMLYEEIPPLCFDGSFAHQDSGRLLGIMRLLNTISDSGMQSILLTCHEREAEIAATVSDAARCHRL